MSNGLPLFEWQPPRQVIPFPAKFRIGHAKRVANQLKTARTNKEADHFLRRAISNFESQLGKAGVEQDDIQREANAFLHIIADECTKNGSAFTPVLDQPEWGQA